jgi:hypothetical protein
MQERRVRPQPCPDELNLTHRTAYSRRTGKNPEKTLVESVSPRRVRRPKGRLLFLGTATFGERRAYAASLNNSPCRGCLFCASSIRFDREFGNLRFLNIFPVFSPVLRIRWGGSSRAVVVGEEICEGRQHCGSSLDYRPGD